jgi:hypothetical protein
LALPSPGDPPVITIPAPAGKPGPAAPTGVVFNDNGGDFTLVNLPPGPPGKGLRANTSAFFLFATEDGTISGWNGGPSAVLKVDNSARAVYKSWPWAAGGAHGLIGRSPARS